MDKNGQKEDNGSNKPVNSYLKFTSMGFQMVAIIGIFAIAGYKIDQATHHNVKWVTASLSLAGVFISLYLVIRSLKS